MYQPSANKIADVYQGNPEALKQRIAQEPKGPTGLPMDLSKLMALNINLTEQDAAKRQAALAGLQQMQQQSPSGEMPTVAQTIQQAAEQKAKLLAVQAQQQQQGLMALAQQGGAPQSGIDELGSNLGQNYAGGGIVAFSGKDDSDVKDPEAEKKLQQYTLAQQGADWVARKQAERLANSKADSEGSSKESLPQFIQDIAKFPEMFDAWKQRARDQDAINAAQDRRMEQYKKDKLEAQQKTSLVNYLIGSPEREKEGLAKLAELSNAPLAKTPSPQPSSTSEKPKEATPLADIRGQLNAAEAKMSGLPAALPKTAPSPEQIAAAQELAAQKQKQVAASQVPAAPTAAKPAAPVEKSLYDKFLEQALSKTPEARREEALARYKKEIGEPDTSAQERYIQQLEASRSRFAEPEDTMGQLRNHLRALANAGGRQWYETGAKASSNEQARKQANAQKDIETLKELMGESSKVADIKRGYKKEAFAFGEKEYDDAFTNGLAAAKEMGLDARQAQLFAHQSAENALQRANAVKVAGMKGSDERQFDSFASDWLKKSENKGKTLSDAYTAFKIAGQGSRPEQSRAAMIEKYASDWNKMDIIEKNNLKKDGINNAADYIKYMINITEQVKPGASSSSTSATVPAVGSVMSGYKFKGGNPADKNNWEKV